MIARVREHLTYANIVATVALLIALSGSAYAVARVTSQDVVNNSLKGIDVRNGTLTGRDVGGNTLGGAQIDETTLTGADRCPGQMVRLGGVVCIDPATRGQYRWGEAVRFCTGVALRLPTPAELYLAYHNGVLDADEGYNWSDAPLDNDDSSLGIDEAVYLNTISGEMEADIVSAYKNTRCATSLSDRY